MYNGIEGKGLRGLNPHMAFLFIAAIIVICSCLMTVHISDGADSLSDDITFESDGLEYRILDDASKIVGVVGCHDLMPSVTIPSEVDHTGSAYTVTTICNGAFKNRLTMCSVTLPDTVTTIEENAFLNCSNLVDVIVTGGFLLDIGSDAFNGCDMGVDLRNGSDIYNLRFYIDPSLTVLHVRPLLGYSGTLYMEWSDIRSTITFDCDGGTPITPITAPAGTKISAPENPTKVGCTFQCWLRDNVVFTFPDTMPAEDITLKAKWIVNMYTITFYDGEDVYLSVEYGYGEQVIVPDDPHKAGCEFDRWDITIPRTMPDRDVAVHAIWIPNVYEVTFNMSTYMQPPDPIDVTYGETYGPLPVVSRTGYDFLGWFTEKNTQIEEDTVVTITEDITLYAHWRIIIYTITFDTDGGTPVDPIFGSYNMPITVPEDPTRTGYTFNGWDRDVPLNMPAENIIITAIWIPNTYRVSFNTCCELPTPEPIDVTYHGTFGPLPVLVRTGYGFLGWFTTDDTPVDDETVVTITEDLTLYAHWEIKIYTITFDTDGGTPVDPISGPYGIPITAPKDPTRTGYTFNGWDRDFPPNMPAENVTMTATWTPITYSIEFRPNEGDGAPHVQSMIYDVPAPLDRNRFFMKWSTFIGWNTEIDGSGTSFDDKAVVTNLSSTDGAVVTLYAQWRLNSHQIKFNSNGGGGDMNPIIVFEGKAEVTVPDSTFVRDGHKFVRWNTSPDCSGTSYSPGDPLDISDLREDMTLYAVWDPDSKWTPIGFCALLGLIGGFVLIMRRP